MNDRMKVRVNDCMNDVCMSYYLNGNKHIKEKKKVIKGTGNPLTNISILQNLPKSSEKLSMGLPIPSDTLNKFVAGLPIPLKVPKREISTAFLCA